MSMWALVCRAHKPSDTDAFIIFQQNLIVSTEFIQALLDKCTVGLIRSPNHQLKKHIPVFTQHDPIIYICFICCVSYTTARCTLGTPRCVSIRHQALCTLMSVPVVFVQVWTGPRCRMEARGTGLPQQGCQAARTLPLNLPIRSGWCSRSSRRRRWLMNTWIPGWRTAAGTLRWVVNNSKHSLKTNPPSFLFALGAWRQGLPVVLCKVSGISL